jgi:3-hydroxymyristoyl/3-hydroxydecanoyl-(acyl carrier protein) dehydratase/1-acyl-sn-glycerol-3-phosphate acyltransferase
MAHAPSAVVPAHRSPMADALGRLAAHQAQLGALHREFLAQQADVHQRFLALRQSTEAMLLRAYAGAAHALPPSYPAPAPALPTPAPPQLAAPPAAATPVVVTPAPAKRTNGVHAPAAAHAPASVSAAPPVAALPGPKFDRAQLEILAGGRISSVFGKLFEAQDEYPRQVRMPQPPLLLADRVTGIDAVAGSMRTGTLWTETDVRHDSWYLNDEGRMPAGIMIESGQADLLLISWLGVDLLNRGERVYRLLGCELTYHGSLPVPGETLVYDIHIDGHAQQGDVRLFFFHYDCRIGGQPRLTVRHGQAGFFTDEELANSAGVLWDCASESPGEGTVDAPAAPCTKKRLDASDVRAFADGRPWDCFGPGWEMTRAHVRTPRITAGRMLFLEEVTELDPSGGPWGRGYLRAESKVTPDDWFFSGHFKNDPCMPGTLMFEGCLQAMAVYLAGLGYTIDRDGWRFEPVPEEKYLMRCRGQVTPASKHLVYEVFVSEVSAGPIPTVFADLLCTVDGRKAFHAKRVGLRLVPDWPLAHWKELGPATTQTTGAPLALRALGGLRGYVEPKPVASVDGFAFDYASLLACAWGQPSTAFGPFYKAFDGTRRVARLPGPPYHFMSRVTHLDAPMGGMKSGSTIEVEYDVPAEQWYFEQNGSETMPFCVLMEAALQPCGWLASYVGSALTTETDLLFRNLDGTGTLFQEILPTSGTLRTRVKLTSVSQTAGMIIQSFTVECFLGDARVYEMKTVFGFFPKEAFENQVGLPVTDEERARIEAPSDFLVDLDARPPRYCGGELCLPGPMLLMLDRVTGYWPEGGRNRLGYLRAEKTVDPDEWFFKAHFFQDPVQPGSLGVDAMCQLLQFFMLERGMGEGMAHPRFEPVMVERPVTWKYRGQVVPKNRTITTELEITEVGEDARGRFAIAEAWLWVDGKRIYHAKNLGMRIVPGTDRPKKKPQSVPAEEILDAATDTWLADHCPTWTLPALPMMSMVDRLVAAATARSGRPVTGLRDVQVRRWLPFPGGPVALRTEVTGEGDERAVTLLAWRDAADRKLSRFEPVATAKAMLAEQGAPPSPFAPLADLVPVSDPYARGSLFHGPAFQYLTELRMGSSGATGTLRAERGSVPRGALHQGLLDAATHAIPHDGLSAWSKDIPADHVAYPYRVTQMRFYAPLPDAGDVRVESRFAGFDGDARFPQIDIQLVQGERVLVAFRLVEVLLPKGPLGAAPPEQRRAFLRDRRFVPGVSLSAFDGTTTRLDEATVRQSDWLPGNVARIYGVPPRADLLTEVAVREHVARRAFVHPSTVAMEADGAGARAAMRPLRLHPIRTERSGTAIAVTDAGPPVQDLAPVRAYWRQRLGIGPWPVEDLYYGLVERFVGDVVLTDPEAFAKVRGRSCLYLANHQVGIESLLFSVLTSALSATPTVTLAKAEHRTSWLGRLIAHSFAYPGVTDPKLITFFDREDRESLLAIVGEIAMEMKTAAKSAMVHVEGTRGLAGRQPVIKMSSAFIDMALAVGAPIVPVRFVGGLPVEPLETRIEFPLGYGKQDYWVGRPILPEELAALPYKDRKAVVIAAINGLGPDLATETPMAPDPAFGAAVEAWMAATGATPEDAVLYTTLAKLERPGDEARALVEGARAGRLVVGADARGQWLGRLAERLYGPRGPAIEGLAAR